VVSPVDCAGCGRADVELCADCRRRLEPAPRSRVLLTGLVVASGLDYEFEVRRAVIAFKQQGRLRLARWLAPALGSALAAALAETSPPGRAPPLLVAVPASRSGLRRRGYDPVRLLAREAGLALAPRLLVSAAGAGAPQKRLDRVQRQRARQGTLRATADLTGRRVLLVDDVVTTGSTLLEAERAVAARGATVVAAACLASTPVTGRPI
jgi:ComF family protein